MTFSVDPAPTFKNPIKIATDFASAPGGRLIKTGPFSGEQFRDEWLAPNLRYAIEHGTVLTVVLDDAVTYPVSFLEEAFGGLIRVSGFAKGDVKKHLKIEVFDRFYEPFKQLAERYLDDAKPQ